MPKARHALTDVERRRAIELAKEAMPIDADYPDFADGVVSAIAANRIVTMAVCASLLTTQQAEKVLAMADEMVSALRVDGDKPMEEKMRKTTAEHVAAFRRSVAWAD